MKWISFLLIFIMLLSGCGTGAQTESKSDSQTESEAEESSTIIKKVVQIRRKAVRLRWWRRMRITCSPSGISVQSWSPQPSTLN